MARVFISHSSVDKEFARRLADDLRKLGQDVWLDEWEIRVGDCIVSKVEKGVADADYVVVVLTEHSVRSGWVDREWKAKYVREVADDRVRVLPVLLESCEIPVLLATKRYADFREDYAVALVTLVAGIEPSLPGPKLPPASSESIEVAELIEALQSSNVSLAESIAKVLVFAERTRRDDLSELCRHELVGYKDMGAAETPPYRQAPAYASTRAVNLQYIGWGGDVQNILAHMERTPSEFAPQKLAISLSVAEIETAARSFSDPVTRLSCMTVRLGDLQGSEGPPETPVFLYGRGDLYAQALTGIRLAVLQALVALLPG